MALPGGSRLSGLEVDLLKGEQEECVIQLVIMVDKVPGTDKNRTFSMPVFSSSSLCVLAHGRVGYFNHERSLTLWQPEAKGRKKEWGPDNPLQARAPGDLTSPQLGTSCLELLPGLER